MLSILKALNNYDALRSKHHAVNHIVPQNKKVSPKGRLSNASAGGGSPLVGMTGLEPAASWSQTKHSTKLSYIPFFQHRMRCFFMVRLTELESALWGVGVPCFIQLNYRRRSLLFCTTIIYYTRFSLFLQYFISEISVNRLFLKCFAKT